MSNTLVTLADVERFTALRNRGLAFPPALERQFEADMQVRRCQRLTRGILVTVVIYNLFLFADWLLLPDVFRRALILHLCVTPVMVAAAWIISRRPSYLVREGLAASVPILMALQIEYCFAATASAMSAHYQYVLVSTLLYANVSLHRLIFPFACAFSTALVLGHAAIAMVWRILPGSLVAMIVVILAVCAYMTVVANYQLERDLRRAYLYSLRERLRRAEADEAARRDALTGLHNRHHLDEVLRSLWARPADSLPVAIVLIDIDHFKHLNDRYGHTVGDLCLKRVAAILTAELRGTEDHAVRFGGEEFLLVLPDMALVDAIRVAERLRRAIERAAIPNEGAGLRGVVTASFGVASSSITDLTATELIAAADAALYAAKNKGRNQVWPPLVTSSEPVTSIEPLLTRKREAATYPATKA